MSGRGRGGRKRTGSSSGRGDRVAGRDSSTGLLGGGFTKKPKFYKYENTEVVKYADIVAGMKRYNSAVTRITDKTLSEDAKIKAELKLVGGEAKKESDEVLYS